MEEKIEEQIEMYADVCVQVIAIVAIIALLICCMKNYINAAEMYFLTLAYR